MRNCLKKWGRCVGDIQAKLDSLFKYGTQDIHII